MACEECKLLDIPEHLCSEGKDLNIPIDSSELLYRRTSEILEGDLTKLDIKVVERIFKVENDSYNRSAFSTPDDVLIDEFGVKYSNQGVFSVNISKFEEMVFDIENEPKQCSFQAVFDPKECNYAHSEIWSFINNVRIEGNKPPKSARRFFRKQILNYIKVIKQPLAS